MPLIGAHMPSDGGIAGSVRNGHAIGCNAIQVFTASPRMWKSVFPTDEKILAFKEAVVAAENPALISHDSYLINLADADPERRTKSKNGLLGELARCAAYGIPLVVSHMGAHMGDGTDVGLKRVAEAALEILAESDPSVALCMETTAGQGTSLNHTFEEIATILDLTKRPDRLRICLDTCHIFAAGYDIRTQETFDQTFDSFQNLIGIDRLAVIHCNDSKKGLGTRVDRHDNLGEGQIGAYPFHRLVTDSRFAAIPIVVETPIENDGHAKNVERLWNWSRTPLV